MIEPVFVDRRLRVLMIGSGRRAQNNFLPALRCLSDTLEIAGLHSRTAERLRPVAERLGVMAFTRLDEVDFSSIDVVAISVPTSQNASVLRSLVSHAARLTVVIDTPIASTRGELKSIAPLLAKFRRVLVTEDYMNFPSFALMRQAVNNSVIGDLVGITLYNVGFQYHGLALIRSFCGFQRVRSTWVRKVGTFSSVIGYSFKGDYGAILVGPYRKNTTGGITIEGSKGILTEFPGDQNFGSTRGRAVYTLKAHRAESGMISGYSLDGLDGNYSLELPELLSMAEMDFPDKSDLNLLRGCGLIKVFRALNEPENINNFYGPENAYYDSFIPRLVQRGLLPFDPLVWLGSDVVSLARKLI